MKTLIDKRNFTILGISIVIVLILLLIIPNKTQRLIKAIESNDAITVKEILDRGVDPNRTNVKPSKFWTFFETHARRPITVACEQGNLQIVRYLIEHGATAEYVEGTGWSPLRTVLFRYDQNDLEIVKLLIENGADPNKKEDVLPVFAAADMIPKEYLLQQNGMRVYSAVYNREVAECITEIVIVLLQDNSINITNDFGETLLMVAVQKGNVCLVKHLLDMGCDVSIKSQKGKTALDYAKENNNDEIIELLTTEDR
ncbi:MAG: hypothetical protein E7565_03455 [Ruminococcaceae bacterium]|nr:hypothetical protein [Oscillospiraceae bacterium]